MSASPLARGGAPVWATEWGEDRIGVYADFRVGDVIHRMRWIPPGRFVMGSPEGEEGRGDNEGPQSDVVLTHGYWLGETPVTQSLWEAVMGEDPNWFKSAERPVDSVSWIDCERFIEALNRRVPGLSVGFPTEAEWEYACRCGSSTATWVGDLNLLGANKAPNLARIAWYAGNSGQGFEIENDYESRVWSAKQYQHKQAGTRPVGLKPANPFGLYDMLGNVWEWCADWFAPYTHSSRVNPMGPPLGTLRVHRGGSWDTDARHVRAAMRGAAEPSYRTVYFGLRLARGQASR